MKDKILIILIEDNKGDAVLIKELLKSNLQFQIDYLPDLESGLKKLDEKKYDIARVKVKVSRAESIESFSIGFKDKKKYIRMTLAWDTTRVSIPIKT